MAQAATAFRRPAPEGGGTFPAVARINDIGGMEGFPRVEPDPQPEVGFHADWEAHLFALNRVLMAHGTYNLDQFRDAVERIPPARYLGASYYERWLDAITSLLVERDLIASTDLADAGHDD
jgi:nitrile hydratase